MPRDPLPGAGAAAPPRVLIVEDDPAMAVALSDGFTYEGFAPVVACDGAAGLRLAAEGNVDVVILDVMLPKVSGLEICERLREARSDVPIIMLTARGQEADKVQGLALGADDYVTKPFSFVELVARVRAVLRRTHRPKAATYAFGDVTLDFERLQATRAGRPLDLSPREMAILECLIARRGEVVTRDQLLQTVWGYKSLPLTRTVDMHIAKLRRKIERTPVAPEFIVTVHGEGYTFVG
jgi:two-component system alkaline phosphatase synthesis response regulator PhoP